MAAARYADVDSFAASSPMTWYTKCDLGMKLCPTIK